MKLSKLKPGVTVLVGCNGAGKTESLREIRDECEEKKIPFYLLDNYSGGAKDTADRIVHFHQYDEKYIYGLTFGSEGGRLKFNLFVLAREIGNFVKEHQDAKKIVIAFDAIDSGLSIDNIIEVKELLHCIADDLGDKGYILVTANTYEMVSNETCINVQTNHISKYESYEDYREFVLKSRQHKDELDAERGDTDG